MTDLSREHCITCSDEAVEAEVVEVRGAEAVVRVTGNRERVAGAPERAAGDPEHATDDPKHATDDPKHATDELERVAVDLVPDAAPGDLLLCHAGIALERLERWPGRSQVAQSHKLPPAQNDNAPQVAQSHKLPPTENDNVPQVAQSHKLPPAQNHKLPQVAQSHNVPHPTQSEPRRAPAGVQATP